MTDFRHFPTVNKSRNLREVGDRKARKNSFLQRTSSIRKSSENPTERSGRPTCQSDQVHAAMYLPISTIETRSYLQIDVADA